MPLSGREKMMQRGNSFALAALGLALVFVCAIQSRSLAAPITAGNLVVVAVGDGVNAINSDTRAVNLREYTTAGVLVQTIPMPTAAAGSNQPLVLSGSATSEGFLQISTDSNYLTMMGYGTAPLSAGVTASTSAAVNRVVGR